ncbi:MAG TPA: hypothetical protein VJ327_11250 [Patescibacteria group bacterium]|nr:hypothetical protein [Patescibacteria group bacterium]
MKAYSDRELNKLLSEYFNYELLILAFDLEDFRSQGLTSEEIEVCINTLYADLKYIRE